MRVSPCRAKDDELIAFLDTRVQAGFRLGGGGTSALTPALSRSGEGECSAASARCGSLGLSCGGHDEPGLGGAAARNLEDNGDVRGRVKWVATQSRETRRWRGRGFVRQVSSSASGCRGAGQGTWCQVQVLASAAKPGSGCGFVLEYVGGELVMTKDCPEFWRQKRGVASGKWRWRRSATTDIGVSSKRARFCHPSGVEDYLRAYPGVSLRATPWLPSGIPSGCGKVPPCTLFQTPEYPESTFWFRTEVF